jgi:hypothetical protein
VSADLLRLLAALWKPLAWLLGALGLYGKGRADAARARDLRAAREYQKTMEKAHDAPVHTDAAAARRRMRARKPDQR